MPTPNRLGIADGSTDNSFEQDNALFLKVYSGEVLTGFRENNIMMGLHQVRTITQGKSASFPIMWKTTASYHTPGNRLEGDDSVRHNEIIINIDDVLLSNILIAQIDEAKNHYDVRSEYSFQQGAALAKESDTNLLRVGVLAAREADDAVITGKPGGHAIENASIGTDAGVIKSAFFEAAQTFDEKDVPGEDRFGALRPAQYYVLAQDTDVINKDWAGENGSLAKGTVKELANITIFKSNNVPNASVSAKSGQNNTYNGDFSVTRGLIWHRSAMGTVKLRDLAVESEYLIELQGTLMVAKYAMGHGRLRAESAIELRTGTPS